MSVTLVVNTDNIYMVLAFATFRLIDLDELSLGSGWMRATAPSGRAAFEGVVSWTPSATAGELPAEKGQSASPPAGGKPPSAEPEAEGHAAEEDESPADGESERSA